MVVRVILFILLFCVSVQADINPRRDSLRIAAFEQSLVPDVGNNLIDTAYGNRTINRAISKVCHDFPALERFDTVVTVDGTRLYSVNADFLRLKTIFKYVVIDEQNVIIPLDYPPVESWFEIKGGEEGAKPPYNKLSEPRYPWVFADLLYFYPTTTSADTFLIAYYAADTSLTTAASETQILPEYREAIILYAAALICVRKGDFTRAQIYRQMYNAELAASIAIREPQKKQ